VESKVIVLSPAERFHDITKSPHQFVLIGGLVAHKMARLRDPDIGNRNDAAVVHKGGNHLNPFMLTLP
jgi:hypothetical protein